MIVNIDPKTNATVSASDVCQAALARKEAYAQELLAIAQREKIGGFVTDWEGEWAPGETQLPRLIRWLTVPFTVRAYQMPQATT